jgi:dihydrofolate reductase
MSINIIAAVAENRAIGYNNQLLYHIKADMKRFRELTTGHTVIMGRKTFESLPGGALPNRRNIVLTRSGKIFAGSESFPSLDEALSNCDQDEDIFIIGGETVYEQALPIADRLYMTEVHSIPEHADAFFPPYGDWKCVRRENFETEKTHRRYTFADYVRA